MEKASNICVDSFIGIQLAEKSRQPAGKQDIKILIKRQPEK
jgi:hypothetical protein